MVEPPLPMETTEDDESDKTRPVQYDGADGARSKNGALARREYDRLELEATWESQASAGAVGG